MTGRIPHVASSPSDVTLFFEQTIFNGQLGHDLLQRAGLASQVLDVAARAVSPASRFFPASRKSFDQR
jgi:hypothetical protein